MSDTETDEKTQHHESMLHWQERVQEHRSSVNSQFLTYAGALLGLEEVQLLADDGALQWTAAFEAAGILAGVSFVIGCVVVLVRLRDAGVTARLAKLAWMNAPAEEIESLSQSSRQFAAWTDRLIPAQVVTFFIAITALIAWIVAAGWSRL